MTLILMNPVRAAPPCAPLLINEGRATNEGRPRRDARTRSFKKSVSPPSQACCIQLDIESFLNYSAASTL